MCGSALDKIESPSNTDRIMNTKFACFSGALLALACSGHQTFDDGSDKLETRPQQDVDEPDAGAEPDPIDAGSSPAPTEAGATSPAATGDSGNEGFAAPTPTAPTPVGPVDAGGGEVGPPATNSGAVTEASTATEAGSGDESLACVTGTGPVETCETEYCLPKENSLVIKEALQFEDSCATWGDGSVDCHPVLTLSQPGSYLGLSFESDLPEEPTTQDLIDLFRVLVINGPVPNVLGPDGAPADPEDFKFDLVVNDPAELDAFSYEDGVIFVRAIVPTLSARRWEESNDPACVTDDVVDRCLCNFDVVTPLTVELEIDIR